jgi:acetyl esterase
MPLDHQAQTALDQIAQMNLPPVHTLSPAQARAAARVPPQELGPDVAAVKDYLVSGHQGMVTARVYAPAGSGPFPVLIWFHGGGWVQGDLEGTDATARELTSLSDCLVVSVDYRLAPETKFPGPVEDCYAATRWVIQNAELLNANPYKVAVGGYSAGGNLAAAVSIMARDRCEISLVFQLLVCPVLDRDFARDSYLRNGDSYGLTRDVMVWYWNHYLRNDSDACDPYAAPLQAADLSHLPPALVISAEYDPLCDEALEYTELLQAAEVPATHIRYAGVTHGFFGMANVIDKGKQALVAAAASLRVAFA